MHCTERETWSCHFPGNAFSKVCKQTNKKKGQSTVNKQSADRDCALQTGPVTWTLGAKGVVLLLRLWLWISKIKQRKKKRNCNKNQNPTKNSNNKSSHYTLNTTTDYVVSVGSFKFYSLTFHFYLCSSAFGITCLWSSLLCSVQDESFIRVWTFSTLFQRLHHRDAKPSIPNKRNIQTASKISSFFYCAHSSGTAGTELCQWLAVFEFQISLIKEMWYVRGTWVRLRSSCLLLIGWRSVRGVSVNRITQQSTTNWNQPFSRYTMSPKAKNANRRPNFKMIEISCAFKPKHLSYTSMLWESHVCEEIPRRLWYFLSGSYSWEWVYLLL